MDASICIFLYLSEYGRVGGWWQWLEFCTAACAPPSDPLWAWSLPTAGPSMPQNSACARPLVPQNSAIASTKPLVPQNTSPVFPPRSSVLTFCLSLALLPWPLFIMVAFGFPQNLGQSSPIIELWLFVFFSPSNNLILKTKNSVSPHWLKYGNTNTEIQCITGRRGRW